MTNRGFEGSKFLEECGHSFGDRVQTFEIF
jgi:hypothetical protein